MHPEETKVYLVVLILATAIISIMVYYTYSVIQHHKMDITKRKVYLLQEMNALERERERIALNLHDAVGPELALIKIKVDNLGISDENDRSAIVEIKQTLDELSHHIRLISHDLMPWNIHAKGFTSALTELCRKVRSGNLYIALDISDDPVIKNETAIHLYRILEEIIYNTLKHSNADLLKIRITTNDSQILIITRDNGQGFDSKSFSDKNAGIGLRSIKYRTEILHGQFNMHTAPGHGVQYQFTFPQIMNEND